MKVKKAKLLPLLFLCLCCLLASCKQTDSGSKLDNLVFAWTEGYLASPVGEENLFVLTFYGKENALPFQLSDIVDISLNNIPEQAFSLRYETELLSDVKKEDGYRAYSVSFHYMSQETGTFDTDSVVFGLSNGKQVTYPFGRITFDFGEADSGLVNTWESTAAVSNPTLFPYSYSYNQEGTKLTAMQIAQDQRIHITTDQELNGDISLGNTYAAPVVLIRSKLFVEENGETHLSYGKGCYCGGVKEFGSILHQSLEHWTSA